MSQTNGLRMATQMDNTDVGDKFSEELIADCREAFTMFDKDGDGCITFDELAEVMRCLGNNPTESQIKTWMSDLDEDNSGTIEFSEFLKIVAKHWKDPMSEEEELRAAFKVFDRDGDGYVVFDEIKAVLQSLGNDWSDQEIKALISGGDADGDGRLDYEEFVKVMQDRWKNCK